MNTAKYKLIGLAGTAGAGKDTVADILCRLYSAENLSTSDFIRAITRYIYRLPADFNPVRDQLFDVATFLRNEVDPAVTVKICILQTQELHIERALISGLRTLGEAEAIRAAGGLIIGVDADPKLRYGRIFARQRDSEAQKTFEQFVAQDEYENRGASAVGEGKGVRAIIDGADVLIDNSGETEALEPLLREKLDTFFR